MNDKNSSHTQRCSTDHCGYASREFIWHECKTSTTATIQIWPIGNNNSNGINLPGPENVCGAADVTLIFFKRTVI